MRWLLAVVIVLFCAYEVDARCTFDRCRDAMKQQREEHYERDRIQAEMNAKRDAEKRADYRWYREKCPVDPQCRHTLFSYRYSRPE